MKPAPIFRLSAADLTNLAVEAPDTPMHEAVLATVDAAGLLDASGRVEIDAIRAHVESRLQGLPELRRVLYRPPTFQGRPIWVDDPNFDIAQHVLLAKLPPPGGEAAVLAFAGREMSVLLDRSRPLWRMWVLEGFARDRVGLLIKLHHAVADGPAMVNMLAQVFDLGVQPRDSRPDPWLPSPRPRARELLRDNIRARAAWLARGIRSLGRPVTGIRRAAAAISSTAEAVRQGRGAPRLSFNRPIGGTRRVDAISLPIAELKAVAHRAGAKLNDVFLYLLASALRDVLLSRGERVDGLSLRVSVAVSTTRFGGPVSGNHAGTVVVSIPIDVMAPDDLLAAVAAATARAKTRQMPVMSTGLMVFLARAGITRLYIRHQHLLNVLTTNLPGPPIPLYFGGGQVRDPIAIAPIAGNVTLSFAALSYDGALTVSAIADGDVWPDLAPLMRAMRASWEALVGTAELRLAG